MEFSSMQNNLQNALDELVSSRSSTTCTLRALSALEHILALACIPAADSSKHLDVFNSLQDTFECNVPSRLLAWISQTTHKLEYLTNKGSMDHERETEATTLSSQLSQSLSIIQGVTLNHHGSKVYLGRRYSLEILLDLLLASRHLSAMPTPSSTNHTPGTKPTTLPPQSPLTSVVLDTLLCVLVDSSPALRTFEETGGVQAVVKLLKRAGTPREVRMKCLEFLYFYLLDETSPSTPGIPPHRPSPTKSSPAHIAPSTPIRTAAGNSKPIPFGVKPKHPSSRSSTYSSFTSISPSSTASASSFSSTSSNASSTLDRCSSFSSNGTGTTSPALSSSSKSPSPSPPADEDGPPTVIPLQTPPSSYPKTPIQPRLMMLQKEVNFVPVSPKRPPGLERSDVGTAKMGSRLRDVSLDGWVKGGSMGSLRSGSGTLEETCQTGNGKRTTEEKKVLLGGLLGNVDALVEGVRKAGVWGLG